MSETQRDLFMEWLQRFGATLRDDEYEGIIDALTEHDRQVAERAWDAGAEMGHRLYAEPMHVVLDRSPYRAEEKS